MLRDASEAEDVSQTVFLEAFKCIRTYSRRAPARTWLIGIAHHRCLDTLEARRIRNERLQSIDGGSEYVDQRPLSDDQLEERIVAAALGECINALKPEARVAVLMRFKEGFSFAAIGSAFGEPPKTLEKRVERALMRLTHCMEKKGVTL
jgi:RNA polymerase sigma-70 factor (ECF subfamily)